MSRYEPWRARQCALAPVPVRGSAEAPGDRPSIDPQKIVTKEATWPQS
jgi:hypothetical protein